MWIIEVTVKLASLIIERGSKWWFFAGGAFLINGIADYFIGKYLLKAAEKMNIRMPLKGKLPDPRILFYGAWALLCIYVVAAVAGFPST